MSGFIGLRPIFKTIGRYYTDIIKKEAVIISQYSSIAHGDPSSTMKPTGFYYSNNFLNASVTYRIPYIIKKEAVWDHIY